MFRDIIPDYLLRELRHLESLAEEFYKKQSRGFQLSQTEENQLYFIEERIELIEKPIRSEIRHQESLIFDKYKETNEKENSCISQRRGGKNV